MSKIKVKKTENKIAFITNQKGSFLTSTEKAVINYIGSYTHDVHKHQYIVALDLGISVRTLQRAINKLIKYGLIIRWYSYFKRVIYKLVSIEAQIAIVQNICANGIQTARNFAEKIADKIRKKPMKSNDLTPVSDLIMTAVSQSTKEDKTKENNIINIEKGDFRNKITISLEEKRLQGLRYLESLKKDLANQT